MTGMTSITLAHDAGEYESALSRAHVEVVRTGAGYGPNALMQASLGGAEVFSGLTQFPVIGRTTMAGNTIALISIVAAPPGTRWCEIDVNAGDVLMYGPGAEHTAVSPEGAEFRFALIDTASISEAAEDLRTPIRFPAAGSVTRVNATPTVQLLRSQLDSLGNPLGREHTTPLTCTGLFQATSMALTEPSPRDRPRPTQCIQSRGVVTACVDYADTIERIPSIAELCLAAHVSERRMRNAFYDTFDLPPSEFFRTRMLSRARAMLLTGEQSVAEVALDHGFNHAGRFSRQYADLFGEYPRDTLATAHTESDR